MMSCRWAASSGSVLQILPTRRSYKPCKSWPVRTSTSAPFYPHRSPDPFLGFGVLMFDGCSTPWRGVLPRSWPVTCYWAAPWQHACHCPRSEKDNAPGWVRARIAVGTLFQAPEWWHCLLHVRIPRRPTTRWRSSVTGRLDVITKLNMHLSCTTQMTCYSMVSSCWRDLLPLCCPI